jgi:UPF0716 family protein affecting phage T7 exclusion
MIKVLLVVFLILPGSFIIAGAAIGALAAMGILFLMSWAGYDYIKQEIRWRKRLRKKYTDPTN